MKSKYLNNRGATYFLRDSNGVDAVHQRIAPKTMKNPLQNAVHVKSIYIFFFTMFFSYLLAQDALAPGWFNDAFLDPWGYPKGDTLSNNGTRTVIGGFDLDQDGAKEIIFTDYFIYGVRLFEYDAENQVFEMKWRSPESLTNRGTYAIPRHIGIGDFDGDGRSEIFYSLSHEGDADSLMGGWYYFEWDGVIGSDYYGSTFSSRNTVEVNVCCTDPGSFVGRTEFVTSGIDIDGDGKQEHISAVRSSTPGVNRGTLVMSLIGDIYTDNGSMGFETWIQEYYIDISSYIGTYAGSPYQALPADLDGDGTWEIMNHYWQNFTLFVIDVTGPDSYEIGTADFGDGWWAATVPTDNVSLFGGAAGDVNNDGDDEVFYCIYGDAGANEDHGKLLVVDYDPGANTLTNLQDHVAIVAEDFGGFYGGIFDVDKNGLANVFGGGSGIKSAELTGSDPLSPDAYTISVIDDGSDREAQEYTITDSAGVIDTLITASSTVFASKVQAEFNREPIDFDNDEYYELLVSYQGNHDSTTYIHRTWNGIDYDSVTTKVRNERNWIAALFEFTGEGVTIEPVRFISPDNYLLKQNYPNPFNARTTIEFNLPIRKTVSLRIYNEMGQLVSTILHNQNLRAGLHKLVWNGTNEIGEPVSSGVYIYSLEWDNYKTTNRMVLLK